MEPRPFLVENLIWRFRRKLAGIYPDPELRQLIYILFEEYLGWDKIMVHISLHVEIQEPELTLFNQALNELYTGKPIQYITGKSVFNEIVLKVDSNVLIPRPETEELCSIIKADDQEIKNKEISILDIGTGSGCIAIDLKKYYPYSCVTAVDNSIEALSVAKDNAVSNHCKISFIHADILNQTDWPHLGRHQIIVSNPPYVLESEKKQMHRNVLDFEPKQALFVSDNDPLLYYKAISVFAVTHLTAPAYLYFEINEQFGAAISAFLYNLGFEDVHVLPDFHGKDRFVAAKLKSSSNLP
ncbi:MAG: peptide chain release factor N(5)-glutamine methyltransferase [Bacteroidetes bacterium]|nr:peptide chain release factor N(5)-glutamine methyltransferase [Bacteroidota bacterium]